MMLVDGFRNLTLEIEYTINHKPLRIIIFLDIYHISIVLYYNRMKIK